MAALHIAFDVYPLATERGVWCSTCEMPSAYRRGWLIADARTLQVEARTVLVACRGCGSCYREDA